MSRAIQDLEHEHEAILSALRILDGIERRVAAGGAVDGSDFSAFVGFLKEFADACHHGKEEGMLFPALVAAGIPEQGGPVGAMLSEHVEGRHWVREMEGAIGPAFDAERFSGAARGYGELLRDHIEKENNVLFPMAGRVLSAAQLEALYEGFEKHESEVIGAGRHEQLHELLRSLARKYSG